MSCLRFSPIYVKMVLLIVLISVGYGAPAVAQSISPETPDNESPLQAPPDIKNKIPLEGDALLDILEDRTHTGYYEFLRVPDGEYAFTEHINADGTSLHIRDGIESRGRWKARANVVCFEYDDLNGGCFTIYKQGTCYYAYAISTKRFVAVLTLDNGPASCEPSYV